MIRREAIEIITSKIGNNPIVAANGYISRDLFEVNDKPSNFYMIGSMGLSSSIGLGIALKNSGKKIYVFDGDGNILMNLGSITTIGTLKPKNFVHIVFDNGIHESTGGQPTNSIYVQIERLAKASNYAVYKTNTKNRLEKILKYIKTISGPIMIVVKIEKGNRISKRISRNPIQIKNHFMNSLSKKSL